MGNGSCDPVFCKDAVDGPFAVINADDYYGKSAFQSIYDQLVEYSDNESISTQW